jgi:hypothetical protein
MNRFKKIVNTIIEIYRLPKVKIKFFGFSDETLSKYKSTYEYFMKPHRLKLFKNKTLGVALIDLDLYTNFDAYYKSINGKNSSAYYSRKALKRAYEFVEIDRNKYVDDIYDINTSSEIRQGQKMSSGYLKKIERYHDEKNSRYFGVVDCQGILVSYCNIGFYGEFSLVVQLLGHKKHLNNGIMYLMMIELNKLIFREYKEKGCRYIMYDTFFGASGGLKKFKEKLGYQSYRVKWIWEK